MEELNEIKNMENGPWRYKLHVDFNYAYFRDARDPEGRVVLRQNLDQVRSLYGLCETVINLMGLTDSFSGDYQVTISEGDGRPVLEIGVKSLPLVKKIKGTLEDHFMRDPTWFRPIMRIQEFGEE